MSIEANKEISRRFVEEIWNKRRSRAADEFVSKDCITHQLRSGEEPSGIPRGPEAIKAHLKEWTTSFPDLHFTIEQMIAEGDRVMMQMVARGTHMDLWRGILPTGKEITIQITVIHRIKNNKIVEDWVLVDFLGVFQQLGLVPQTMDLLAGADKGRGENHKDTKDTKKE
jgi:steroid delta-isomerase-like uncharacterized protein